MIDPAHAEAVTYRVAVTALTHDPTTATSPLGHTLDEDLDWCLQPISDVPADTLGQIRDAARATIEDPTHHRGSFRGLLASLTHSDGRRP